jgi:tyrosyl-tRNA synthetase
VRGGAIRLNDQQVSDEKLVLRLNLLSRDGAIKLSMGKKKHVLVKPA